MKDDLQHLHIKDQIEQDLSKRKFYSQRQQILQRLSKPETHPKKQRTFYFTQIGIISIAVFLISILGLTEFAIKPNNTSDIYDSLSPDKKDTEITLENSKHWNGQQWKEYLLSSWVEVRKPFESLELSYVYKDTVMTKTQNTNYTYKSEVLTYYSKASIQDLQTNVNKRIEKYITDDEILTIRHDQKEYDEIKTNLTGTELINNHGQVSDLPLRPFSQLNSLGLFRYNWFVNEIDTKNGIVTLQGDGGPEALPTFMMKVDFNHNIVTELEIYNSNNEAVTQMKVNLLAVNSSSDANNLVPVIPQDYTVKELIDFQDKWFEEAVEHVETWNDISSYEKNGRTIRINVGPNSLMNEVDLVETYLSTIYEVAIPEEYQIPQRDDDFWYGFQLDFIINTPDGKVLKGKTNSDLLEFYDFQNSRPTIIWEKE